MLLRVSKVAAILAISNLVVACGGGGGAGTPGVPPAPQPTQTAQGDLASVTWEMQWASKKPSAIGRGPLYLAPTARSASIQTLSVGGAAGAQIQYINAPQTTLTFEAVKGLDTFLIKTYDEQNGQGNVLSTADVTQNITTAQSASGNANVIATTLNGVIASLAASIAYPNGATGFQIGSSGNATVIVTAYDADGNAILETVPGATSDFNTPIHVALADSQGALTLASTLLQTTSTTPPSTTLSYNGGALVQGASLTASATVTATATASATVTSASAPVAIMPLVTTYCGSGTPGNVGGSCSGAEFNYPEGVAVDAAGRIYVADEVNGAVRVISGGAVSTAFSSVPFPSSVAVDLSGNVWIGGGSGAVLEGAPGQVSLSAYLVAFDTDSRLGVAVDTAGNAYVAVEFEQVILKITPAGVVTTVAGAPGQYAFINGNGSAAAFAGPNGVAVDAAGNVYVADTGNNAIRKIDPSGNVTTLAGGGPLVPGNLNGNGTAAEFNAPCGVAVDAAGNVYVADTGNNAIRRIDTSGNVTTLSGASQPFPVTFNSPQGVAVDSAGNVYVADSANNVIREIQQ